MISITKTDEFDAWLRRLRDIQAFVRIQKRLTRIEIGNFGDCKNVGDKVFEMRIDYGPGYRVYFTRRGKEIVLLLIGGDKSTQAKDILLAKALAKEYGA
jgi:putative addiction module killer protein